MGANGNRTSLDRRCSSVPVRVHRTTGTVNMRLLYRSGVRGLLTRIGSVPGSHTILHTVRFCRRGEHITSTIGTIRGGSNRKFLHLLRRSNGSS